MAQLNFDATNVTPDAGFDPLPVGWYNAQIDESEQKPTADGTGWYLKTRFNIMDGKYAGRKIYFNFNLKNNSSQAVEIAQKQLSAVCHAVGVLKPTQSEELHGKPLKIKLKIRPAQGDYEASNDITAFKNINEQVDMAGGDSGGAGAAAFGAAGAGAFGGGAPAQPWANGAAAAAVSEQQAPASTAQPWANAPATTQADTPPPATEPAAPPPPPAPTTAPVAPPSHDPLAAATADGWIQHPSSPPHMYKGQDVKTIEAVKELYPAPAPAVPEVPAAPDVPPAPTTAATAAAPAGSTATPTSDPAAASQTAAPPWAQTK